jgi:hypothetical protein
MGDGLSPVSFTMMMKQVFKKSVVDDLLLAALSKIHGSLKSMIDAMALVM